MGQKIPVWEMVDDLVLQSTAFIQERCQKKAVRAQPKTLWRKSLNTRVRSLYLTQKAVGRHLRFLNPGVRAKWEMGDNVETVAMVQGEITRNSTRVMVVVLRS